MKRTPSPRWIDVTAVKLLHQESLAEHGGLSGLRDTSLLESAMARARNLNAYENVTDLARLAAAYGFGIVRNHPFNDGNKRAGFLAIGLFLALNERQLTADPIEAIAVIFRLAEGRLREEELATWIRANMSK